MWSCKEKSHLFSSSHRRCPFHLVLFLYIYASWERRDMWECKECNHCLKMDLPDCLMANFVFTWLLYKKLNSLLFLRSGLSDGPPPLASSAWDPPRVRRKDHPHPVCISSTYYQNFHALHLSECKLLLWLGTCQSVLFPIDGFIPDSSGTPYLRLI